MDSSFSAEDALWWIESQQAEYDEERRYRPGVIETWSAGLAHARAEAHKWVDALALEAREECGEDLHDEDIEIDESELKAKFREFYLDYTGGDNND